MAIALIRAGAGKLIDESYTINLGNSIRPVRILNWCSPIDRENWRNFHFLRQRTSVFLVFDARLLICFLYFVF